MIYDIVLYFLAAAACLRACAGFVTFEDFFRIIKTKGDPLNDLGDEDDEESDEQGERVVSERAVGGDLRARAGSAGRGAR